MKLQFRLLLLPAAAFTVFSSGAFGADKFEYPELNVAPRASERLQLEAREEGRKSLLAQLPLELSGVSTLVGGLMQFGNTDTSRDPGGKSGWVGVGVGGLWLATAIYLSSGAYQPFASGWDDVRNLPVKNPRDELIRERLAEEAIARAASIATRVKYLAVVTNLGASAYLLANAQNGSSAFVADIVALGLAFAPLVFPQNAEQVARDQREYKKKIYAPIASAAFFSDSGSGRTAPGISLSFRF